MAESPLGEHQIPDPPTDEPRLESWGEIAAYLRREIRTVQRWERYQGLPVRRLQIGKLGSVYAYRSELDKWYRERQPHAENGEEDSEKAGNADVATHVAASTETDKQKPQGQTDGAQLPPPRPRITRLHITITLLTLLIVAAVTPAVYFLHSSRSPMRSTRAEKIRLVVLPFANLSGDPQQDYFSAGLTDEMITQLGRLDPERLGVIAATASRLFAGKPIAEIGRTLDVQYALEGSVRRGGNQVRIDVQLIQVSDQTHLWADSYTGDLGDILHVQDEVTAAVAGQIRGALPVGALGVDAARTVRTINPDAYDDYLRGRFYWTNRGDLYKSVDAYEKAIQKDPSYALAYAGLASGYALLGQVPYDDLRPGDAKPKARQAAERALQLDPQLGEAHSVLANVSYSYDWDFEAAEREFQRALALGQNDPTAHLWFSHYCIVRNRLEQALEENSRTLALDPVSPLFNTERAEIYYNGRQYDSAIAQSRRVIDQYPTYPLAYIWLGSAYREKKMYKEALEQFSQGVKFSGDRPAMLALYGHALALSGDAAGARKVLADLQHLAHSRYVSSLYVAGVYTGLGEKNTALDWLDKAYKEHNDRLVYLNVDPMADPLRSEPRFQQLMKRLHLQ